MNATKVELTSGQRGMTAIHYSPLEHTHSLRDLHQGSSSRKILTIAPIPQW